MSKILIKGKIEQQNNKDTINGFIKCQNCDGVKFQQQYVLKKITPIQDPNLTQNSVLPMPIFTCIKCGKVVNIYG